MNTELNAPGVDSAALRSFDAFRWHYITVLQQRAADAPATLRQALEQKADAARQSLLEDFARQQAASSTPDPDAGLGTTPLGELLRTLAQQPPPSGSDMTSARPELKAVAAFRSTWAQLAAGRQLSRAVEQAPENAGPLNSHMLVLRALERMQATSPAYLKHFLAYVDTLLRLEQAQPRPALKRPAKGKAAKR